MPLHASHAAELAEFLSAVRRTFELTAADRSKQHPTSPEPALTSTTPASASNEPAQTLRFEFAGSGSFNQPDFEGSLSCSAFTRAGRACAAPPRMGQPFCIFHDPEYAEAQRSNSAAAGRASGQARRKAADSVTPVDVSTPRSRADLLGYLVGATLSGKLSESTTRALQRSIEIARRDEMGESVAQFFQDGDPRRLSLTLP